MNGENQTSIKDRSAGLYILNKHQEIPIVLRLLY
jgi:hypothetical protein